MKFDYNALLRAQIYEYKSEVGLTGYDFEIDSEQAFLKKKDLKPKTIYILTKELQNDNSIGVDTQPVQILILAEQNGLGEAQAFFGGFSKKYNFTTYSRDYTEEGAQHNIWVKQQYSDPVVLSNFNTVNYGYRSVLYIAATLFIMYDVVDLKNLTIDGNSYKALTWDIAYSMSPNTQQVSGETEFISKSVKSVSSLAITITIPVVSSALTTKILSIMDEADSAPEEHADPSSFGGNEDFIFSFTLGTYPFSNKKMKLISADFAAAVNDIPAIRLGFMK